MFDTLSIDTPYKPIHAKAAGDPHAPLVFGIHGFSQRNSWRTWEPLLDPLGAAGYRVVSVDMPGWGKSPGWDTMEPDAAAWMAITSLTRDPVVMMGKSWGGGIALRLALAHPDQVSHLILTAPAFRGTAAGLARLTQPVLLAWAEDDTVIPISHGEEMAAAIPTCTFVRYGTGGHSAAPNNAEDFAARAVDFLKN